MKKTIALLILLAAAPLWAGGKVELSVKGMVCGFCAQGLEKKFKKQPEVDAVKVDLGKKTVSLTLKDGKDLPDDRLTEIVNDAGYDVLEIRRKGNAP